MCPIDWKGGIKNHLVLSINHCIGCLKTSKWVSCRTGDKNWFSAAFAWVWSLLFNRKIVTHFHVSRVNVEDSPSELINNWFVEQNFKGKHFGTLSPRDSLTTFQIAWTDAEVRKISLNQIWHPPFHYFSLYFKLSLGDHFSILFALK